MTEVEEMASSNYHNAASAAYGMPLCSEPLVIAGLRWTSRTAIARSRQSIVLRLVVSVVGHYHQTSSLR